MRGIGGYRLFVFKRSMYLNLYYYIVIQIIT